MRLKKLFLFLIIVALLYTGSALAGGLFDGLLDNFTPVPTQTPAPAQAGSPDVASIPQVEMLTDAGLQPDSLTQDGSQLHIICQQASFEQVCAYFLLLRDEAALLPGEWFLQHIEYDAVLNQLHITLQSSAGTSSQQSSLPGSPAQGSSSAQCSECGGTRDCGLCAGLQTCSVCLGEKTVFCDSFTCLFGRCTECDDGYILIRFDNNDNPVYRKCSHCLNGVCRKCEGTTVIPCSACGATGKCSRCGGQGTCITCAGQP